MGNMARGTKLGKAKRLKKQVEKKAKLKELAEQAAVLLAPKTTYEPKFVTDRYGSRIKNPNYIK